MSERIVYQRENFRPNMQQLPNDKFKTNSCPVRPVKNSQGKMSDMFVKMADTMLTLYDQEERLIASVTEMLNRMAKNLDNADETSANM